MSPESLPAVMQAALDCLKRCEQPGRAPFSELRTALKELRASGNYTDEELDAIENAVLRALIKSDG